MLSGYHPGLTVPSPTDSVHKDTPGIVVGASEVCLLSSIGLPTAPLSEVPDL